jgi:translation initiation factor 2B subunit (eIF-2B alpha/beta/delta family)
VKLLIDSAAAYSMDEVDMVFVGADGVVESGGIINMMGTYQIALVAHSMNKPVYVAAESYKVYQTLFFTISNQRNHCVKTAQLIRVIRVVAFIPFLLKNIMYTSQRSPELKQFFLIFLPPDIDIV